MHLLYTLVNCDHEITFLTILQLLNDIVKMNYKQLIMDDFKIDRLVCIENLLLIFIRFANLK